jgi:mitotic spindle assembly checkpoint protein MAD1
MMILVSEAERDKFQGQLRFVEQELAAAKGREQALQEQLMKEVNESFERHQAQLKQYSELEVAHFFLLNVLLVS